MAVGKEKRIWCFMGGISEKDINLKAPTKLALLGFLSFHMAFKAQCRAEECKRCWKCLCWSLWAKVLWAVALEAACIHRTCCRNKWPRPCVWAVSTQLCWQRGELEQCWERATFHVHVWTGLLLTWWFFLGEVLFESSVELAISLLIAV